MKFFGRKLLSLLTIIALLAGPVSVAAQGFDITQSFTGGPDDNFLGDIQGTPTSFSQVNIEELPGTVTTGSRAGDLAQRANLQQLMNDRVKCEAEAPKPKDTTSAIGRGLAEGMGKSAIEAIKQGLPENMMSYVQSDLPQRLTNNLQNKLGPEFANRLEAELMSGLDPEDIDDALVSQLMRESIDAVIKGSVQESVQDSIPRAINQSVKEGMGANLKENIQSSIRYSTEGPFRNTLNSFLAGNGNIGENLINGVLDNMSSQLTNALMSQLEGSMDEIVSSVTEGVMGSLDSSLNQITGDLTGSIDEIIGTLDGSLQDITDSLTGALTQPIDAITGNLTDSIDDLTGSLQDSLGNITGQLDEMTDKLTQSITNPINDLTDKITGSIDKFTNQITESLYSPVNQVMEQAQEAVGGVIETATKPLTNIVQKPAEFIQQAGTNLVSKIPGVGGLASGLLSSSVPVHEVGDLLQVTKDIKDIEGESRDVLIEICGHIKDVRRVQLAFEQKEFVQDAQARQAASDEVEKYNKAYLKFVDEGYAVDANGQKGNLIIENLDDYILEGTDEITKVFISEYENNDSDIFSQETKEALLRNIAEGKYLPYSTITKEEYDKLADPKDLTSAEFLSLLNKAYDPSKPNNPITSYNISKNILEAARSISESNRINELSSSGFKPVRECAELAPDGQTCVKWQTVTPGSVIQGEVSNTFGSRLRQLEQADEVTDIGEDTPIPTPAQSQTFEADDATAGGSPGFNGNFAQNIFSGLLARLRGLFNNGGNGGGGGGGGEEGEPPVATFTFNTASVAEINGGEANAAFLNLSTQGASECKAANNWLSLRPSGNKAEVVVAQGASVGTSGSLKISLPLNFSLRMERVRGEEVTTFTPATTVNASLTQQISSLNFGSSQVAAGDTFKLVVKAIDQEQSVSVTAGSANAAAVVSALQQAVLSLGATTDQGKEFKALRLTFNSNQSGEGFITATIDPTYRLTCSNQNGSTNASVTITR